MNNEQKAIIEAANNLVCDYSELLESPSLSAFMEKAFPDAIEYIDFLIDMVNQLEVENEEMRAQMRNEG